MAVLLLFLISRISVLQITPDYLNLGKIESPQSYILRLLSIVIGFSSFILTILLLIYNSFSKKIKRNSFDFVFDNPWVKITFSLFSSSLIFIFLILLSLNISDTNTIITLLYLSSFIAFGNLLIQFPLLILSIKHSNSYKIIDKLIGKINETELQNLYNPSGIEEIKFIEVLERNSLTQLKDIGITAIKENDWGLPQTIINNLFDKLIKPLNKKTSKEEIILNVNAFNFIARHFKKIAIEESDEITVNVLLGNLIRVHTHFAKNEIRDIRSNPIDNSIIDLNRLIIENNDFYSIQPYILRYSIDIINEHIKSFNFSDDEIPTFDYRIENRDKELSRDFTPEKNYWYYLKDVLPDLFLKPLEFAIENGNKNAHSSYIDLKLHSFLDTITSNDTLSHHQQYEIFTKYSYKARRISDLAIQNGIYSSILFYSDTQVATWIEEKKKFGLKALFDISYFLTSLNKREILSSDAINDFFMIGRELSSKLLEQETKNRVFELILETGFEIYENSKSQEFVKDEMKKQITWLDTYLTKENSLDKIRFEFSDKISEIAST